MRQSDHTAQRGCLFWSLAPCLLLFMVLMPFLGNRNPVAIATLVGMELLAGLLLLGLFNRARFWWAWRCAAAEIFVMYLIYLVVMLSGGGGTVGQNAVRSSSPVGLALGGMLVIGLPALLFALTGRLPGMERDAPDGDDDRFHS